MSENPQWGGDLKVSNAQNARLCDTRDSIARDVFDMTLRRCEGNAPPPIAAYHDRGQPEGEGDVKPKICKDCVFYQTDDPCADGRLPVHTCCHDTSIRTDLVTGYQERKDCWEMRQEACGVDARLFVPRNP